jgi:adenosylcobinamide-GDP ribazoletransferase
MTISKSQLLQRRDEFFIALRFLTIWNPQGGATGGMDAVGRSGWAFPLVGASIGLALVFLHWPLVNIFPPLVGSALLVILWIMVTGGLHLDGWADCCDALPATGDMERRRVILKDSRLGSFAGLGLISILILKVAAISTLSAPGVGILVAAILGRAMIIVAGYGIETGPKGMAAQFINSLNRNQVAASILIAAGFLLLSPVRGLIAAALCAIAAMLFRKLFMNRLGVINGDALGAICELCEVITLTLFSAKI